MEESITQNIYSIKSIIKCDLMKKKTTVILLILTLSIYALNINVQKTAEENNYRPTSLELTPHDRISITSDSDFLVFPGSGTAENPYVIEGYNITTGDEGIYIRGTTKYFIIRNCYVDAREYGIYIDDVADGTATVINNTCNNNNYYGISLSSTVRATVANNTFTNCGLRIAEDTIDAYLSYTVSNNWVNGKKLGLYINLDSTIIAEPVYGQLILVNCTNATVRDQILNSASTGLFLYSCTSSVIINNTCNNNNWSGIWLWDSCNSTVANNTCSNNNRGCIYLDYSGSSTVANNTCSNNNNDVIYLSYSGNSTVANNTCNNNNDYGICLYVSSCSTVANNTFTNCGLRIAEDTIDAYLSYTVSNNWVNGKKLGLYINLDSTIIAEPVYGQLILVNCTNVTVRDQILNNATVGLSLDRCTSSVIINNTCSNNNHGGILFWFSGSSTIVNNTCSNNNYRGISLEFSGSSTVTNNTCSNNNGEGIRLLHSNFCVLSYNLLQENEGYGVSLGQISWGIIEYNLLILQENDEYGVYLLYNSDNLIHHNTFVDNNLGGFSQAFDEGSNNLWYDTETSEGNYWSDWSGTGSYSIAGFAGSEDLYPLDEPAEYSTDENPLIFMFTLLILVVPLLLTRIISKKVKKK